MEEKKENNFMIKVSTFIVDKRNLFFLLFIIASAFSVVSMNWVKVENELSAYLSETTETRQGLDIMEEEFITYGTAKIMVENVTYDQAKKLSEQAEEVEGVFSVTFDDSKEHFSDASALFDITFDYSETDAKCEEVLENVRKTLDGYDSYVSCELGDTASKNLQKEMSQIIVIVAVIVVAVLLFTSKTYAEVPVLLITFVSAAVLNMGTNFLFGTISFISNSVTVVLQLALAIDYAIILCHRYTEEHETLPTREAVIIALSKAIPEISSSSLTTISGLIALTFMQFKIGADMGIVLVKAILLSLLSVFTLMPGLLVLFSKLIDRSHHRNYVPKITAVGRLDVLTRFIVPPVFLVVIIGGAIYSNRCPYVYGYSTLSTPILNETQVAEKKITDTFGSNNMTAVVIPAGHYDKEKELLKNLEAYQEVDSTLGLSSTEAMNDYMLTDELTPREFSELIDMDYEVAELIYAAYAVNDENYGEVINGLSSYSVPLIDMFLFVHDEVEEGYVTVDQELEDEINDLYEQLTMAKRQLLGKDYSRMLVYLNLPEESDETFRFLDTMHEEAERIFGSNVYVVGESTSQRDLASSFVNDNKLISVLSALFVMVILLFTFKSAGMPVLLIIVIQGSIWINFAFPYLTSSNLFFMSYLIVSSIQMGANIDYAIVISSRYLELKKEMNVKDAMVETLNQAFPTIVTSGSILACAGILIGQMTSDAAIVAIGQCLGRGTLISIFLVLCVLPQILLLGDKIIEKTAFVMNVGLPVQNISGVVYLDGRVRGRISGNVDAVVRGVVHGEVSALIETGAAQVFEEKESESEDGNAAKKGALVEQTAKDLALGERNKVVDQKSEPEAKTRTADGKDTQSQGNNDGVRGNGVEKNGTETRAAGAVSGSESQSLDGGMMPIGERSAAEKEVRKAVGDAKKDSASNHKTGGHA